MFGPNEPSPATKAVAIVASRMIMTDALRPRGADNVIRYFEKNFGDLPPGPDRDYLMKVLDFHLRLQTAVDDEEMD